MMSKKLLSIKSTSLAIGISIFALWCTTTTVVVAFFEFEFDDESMFGDGGHYQQHMVEPEAEDDEEHLALYEVLELDNDATEKQIKKAYRKLSLKHHPDKNNNNPSSNEKFAKVSEAYEILSDPEKRIMYDFGGMNAVKKNPEEQQGFSLGSFFGFGGNSNSNRGSDSQFKVPVTLEDLYNGLTRNVEFTRRIICRGCKKNPNRPSCKKCGACPKQTRMVQRQVAPGYIVQSQEEVPSKFKCRQAEESVEVVIEKGMSHGHEIRFKHKSQQTPGKIPGDVIISLSQRRHKIFERKGDDLHAKVHLTLKESLTGFRKSITHLDGRSVTLSSSGITTPGQVKRIRGEGMPIHEYPSQHGDLLVRYEIDFPSKLTDEQKKSINDIL